MWILRNTPEKCGDHGNWQNLIINRIKNQYHYNKIL